jgi:endonuclease IV
VEERAAKRRGSRAFKKNNRKIVRGTEFAHAAYLINPGFADDALRIKSIDAMTDE